MRNALHHAAIAAEREYMVAEYRIALFVVLRSHVLFSHSHTNRHSHALSERTCGSFDTCGMSVLGMSGCLGIKLSELHQILFGEAVAEQMKKRIKKHGAVAAGKNETVSVPPIGILRVMIHFLSPENVCDIRTA